MANLFEYGKRLQEAALEIISLIGSGEHISKQKSRKIITLFVKIDEIKKSIVSILFHDNGRETSARDRILAYLKSNVGEKVSGRELSQVGGISEYARRIRELRHEHGGWQISTGMNRSDLRPDEYLLESLNQRPVYERMNAQVWAEVLERDSFTCQNCGWKKGDPQTNNRKFLEVHHRNPVKAQGEPTIENLITLCNVCHDAIA
ncbi:hypothetical protein COW99_00700 [Candidatus Roizmanbacteria bacterium CG22_combo_CG10-13_8_21_14_all_38_20]|uniref:HNH nuclease domain-containing protein n=1 Tax=Candidatus Roizmanbacteria bacterium CG22_combo_CG10-13_8_21_14_all_38_20 TaxID=1974862 RepID=A0A2H0BYE5_9BACT|nr:hypothetical protein [Candidatus Microgenomates bacterium]PIP62050.1 MAG: hypothetical protein COW99_00700 [Candidatus Roizmanbacteria bacterium CG22_combo_CG10-13_8_21_14_all_38_20]PJC31289.1 MAG: hypothetical protein CO050_03425 [Candidatus Roizmanbacteria bacterium CG_4_9_14_0_2_um_filter_38_17]